MSFVIKNNANSTVADNPLTAGAITLNVASGEGSNFPSTFPFMITIWDVSSYPDSGNDAGMEIVKCTARTTDALTIVRAQEGTTDVEHTLGEKVAMLITAEIINSKVNISGDTITGDIIFSGSGSGLPYGEISAISNSTETAIATQNVYVQVIIFDTNGENNLTTPDHTNDHIIIVKAGKYFVSCSITLNSIGGPGSTVEIEIKKNNGNVRVGSLHDDRTLSGGGAESGAITLTGIANLSVDDTIEVWIRNESNTQNYIVEDITLSIIQIGG